MMAYFPHGTTTAIVSLCLAVVSAELDYSVAEGGLFVLWDNGVHQTLDLHGIAECLGVEAESAADPHKMRVTNYTAHAEYVTHNKVCDLPAHTRHLQECIHIAGDHTAVIFNDTAALTYDVRRLHPVQSARLDDLLHTAHVRIGKGIHRGKLCEKIAAYDVHPCIGALCGQPCHYYKPPRMTAVLKSAGVVGVQLRQHLRYVFVKLCRLIL